MTPFEQAKHNVAKNAHLYAQALWNSLSAETQKTAFVARSMAYTAYEAQPHMNDDPQAFISFNLCYDWLPHGTFPENALLDEFGECFTNEAAAFLDGLIELYNVVELRNPDEIIEE